MRHVLSLVAWSLFFAYLLFPLVRLAQQWVIQSLAQQGVRSEDAGHDAETRGRR